MFPSKFDPIKSEADHLIYHADTDKVSYLDNIITIDIIMLYLVTGQTLVSFLSKTRARQTVQWCNLQMVGCK